MGADADPSAAVLRAEVRRILGEQTPELIKALSGRELQEILLEAHAKANGSADGSAQMEGPELSHPSLPGLPGLGQLPRPQGLTNLGNTCYLASVLQCLAQTESFATELQELKISQLGGIGQALQRLLGNLRQDSQASVEDILGQLAERYTWYQGKSQQDAHELLRTLLAALADEREVKEEKDVLQRLVQRSFQGLICEAILCWSCRQVSLRHEFFLDLSLDISELDTGRLGLRGSVMQPLLDLLEEEDEDEAAAVEEPVTDGEDQVIEVYLERVPGRRIPLGLEWHDATKHNCKVLRRVHPNSLADQWTRRSGRRLVGNLLLLSVNGQEDEEEIMQVLKDEAKLLLRFAPEEVVSARVNDKTQQGFQIELQRDAKTPWGFQLDPVALEEGNLIVAQILPDSVLDAWNLRCRSMGRKQQLVHCGDKILAVNGSREMQQMTKALNSQARQKNVVLLEPGDRSGYSASLPSSAPPTEDATFQVELEPIASISWGFQLERMDGESDVARVKGLEEGSPVALWNMVCRSRGDEHLCVEADDVLLDAKNAMAAASGRDRLRRFTLRRSRDRQASVRAAGYGDRFRSGPPATTGAARTAEMEDLRQAMLHAADGCAAQLTATASPLAALFGATGTVSATVSATPRAVCLADCVRNLGSIEALEENFQPIYHCSCCGSDATRRFASKRTWLQQLPPVLPVQLKRFRFDAHTGSFQKSRMRIQTSSTLDLSELLLSSEQQQQLQSCMKDSSATRQHEGEAMGTLYELYAVCAHLGGSMERGHYVAFINVGASLKEESWFLLDDAKCVPVRREDALKVEAYIAFYRRSATS